MGLRVNTNIASMTAQRQMGVVTSRLQGNYSRLASGLRISTAADDAAGLAISERMRSQIRSLGAAGRNAQDGISLVQTAEGALNEVSNLLGRMRELSVQSANGTLSTADRTTINDEVTALVAEIDRIASSVEFNGITLLDGSAAGTSIQVGLDAAETIGVTLQDATTATLGVDVIDVTTAAGANTALSLVDTAIDTVNAARGSLGASQNRCRVRSPRSPTRARTSRAPRAASATSTWPAKPLT